MSNSEQLHHIDSSTESEGEEFRPSSSSIPFVAEASSLRAPLSKAAAIEELSGINNRKALGGQRPKEDKKPRSLNWPNADGELLCKAWVNISEDPVMSSERRYNDFFRGVAAYYNTHSEFNVSRSSGDACKTLDQSLERYFKVLWMLQQAEPRILQRRERRFKGIVYILPYI